MSLLDLLSLFLVASAVSPATGTVPKHFYPFGDAAGDTMLPPAGMSYSDTIQFSRPFPYYGIQREQMWVGGSTFITAEGVVIPNVTSDAK